MPSKATLVQKYGFLIALTLLLANVGVAVVTNLRTKAQTCFTTDQVQSDARCLYIYSNKVYEKGTKAAPHKSHPCGMDVTSILPSFHFTFAGFTSAYLGDICVAPSPTPTTPLASPTPSSPSPTPFTSPQPTSAGGQPTPTPNPFCPKKPIGDADCDGQIKLADYAAWRSEFYGELTTKTADFNGSGTVTLADHSIWRQTFFDLNGGLTLTPTP